tara:strand:- start:1377 stop:1634 length:258 start_codon:yes stop_codon:yes gene_type:complete
LKKIGSAKPFGASALKRLKVGDLVWWSSLETDDKNKWFEKKTQGVLTNIIIEEVGGRQVYFGEVIPIKNQITCKVFLYLLEKVTI